jgi:hypothetical protein
LYQSLVLVTVCGNSQQGLNFKFGNQADFHWPLPKDRFYVEMTVNP